MEETVINNPLNEGELKLKLRLQDIEAQTSGSQNKK